MKRKRTVWVVEEENLSLPRIVIWRPIVAYTIKRDADNDARAYSNFDGPRGWKYRVVKYGPTLT